MNSNPQSLDAPASQAVAVSGRFVGKVALVTGTSERGIGGAIIERLASEGADVVLLSRNEPKRLRKRLDRMQRRHLFAACDVTRADQVAAAIEAAGEMFGRLDVVVNNAGVEIAKPLEQFAEARWRDLLDVNLHGAIRVTQAALPRLTSPSGVIVNVASALALGGCPGFSIYSAAKAGMIGLTQSLAWELAPRQIRVVCVAPALVQTPMTFKHAQHFTPQAQAQVESCHPLGIGSPHDVAAAVAFLASSEARWITGVTLPLGFAGQFPLPVDPFMAEEPAAAEASLQPGRAEPQAAESAAPGPRPRPR